MAEDKGRRKSTLPYGAYAEVARRIGGVTPQAVRLVDLGTAVSARISEAIDDYRRDLAADLLAGVKRRRRPTAPAA